MHRINITFLNGYRVSIGTSRMQFIRNAIIYGLRYNATILKLQVKPLLDKLYGSTFNCTLERRFP